MIDWRQSEPKCLICGYTLLGLTSRVCPECGQAFAPENPRSFAYDWSPRIASWLRPPSWLHIVLVSAATLWGIYEASFPRGEMVHWLFEATLWIMAILFVYAIIFVDYVIRLGARNRYTLLPSPKQPTDRSLRWRWFVAPTCFAVLLSVVFTTWPLVLRFRLSQRDFEAHVAAVQAGRQPSVPCRVGLYWVEKIERQSPNVVYFSLPAESYLTVGFEYSPGRKTYSHGEQYTNRLTDSWCAIWSDS